MPRVVTTRALLALVLLSLPFASASAHASPLASVATYASTKPVLRYGDGGSLPTLDPAKAPQYHIFALSNEAILHQKPDGSFGPGLAESWRYVTTKAGARKSLEFTLRKNARFSDGTRVTAGAVKTWFEYFIKANGPYVSIMGPVRSIETIGQWTVRINLKSPNPVIPALLSEYYNWGLVSSPNAVANPTVLGTRTFGAGPYVLLPSETVTGDTYTYVPNKFYYDKSKITHSKIVIKVIASPSSRLQALQSGQIDAALGDLSTANAAGAAGFRVVRAPTSVVALTFADLGGALAKPIADVRVRQALNYAVNRKAITAAVVGKYGKPSSLVASADAYDPKLANSYPYDPAKARSLLAAAGYASGFELDVVPQGYNGAIGLPTVLAVADNLADIGVKLQVKNAATPPEWLQAVFSHTYPLIQHDSHFDRTMWTQYGFYFKPGGIFNQHGWIDPVLNRLWLKGQRADNPATYWKQMAQRVVQQAYMLPIFSADTLYYVPKRMRGVVLTRAQFLPFLPEWSSS